MTQLQDIFLEEASDLLPELEDALLELEGNPEDEDTIARIFRAMHTIKGSGSMCDFPNVASFTHELENIFDRVRKGELRVNKKLLEQGLASHSYISSLLESADEMTPSLRETEQSILTELKAFSPEQSEGDESSESALLVTGSSQSRNDENKTAGLDCELRHYRIRFKPERALLTYGINPLNFLQRLAEMGQVHCIAYLEELPSLSELDETLCYTSWGIIFQSDHAPAEVADVFSLVEDDSDIDITVIDAESDGSEQYQRLGDILLERGDISRDQIQSLFEQRERLGETMVSSGLVSQEKVDSALLEQNVVREQRQARQQVKAGDSVKVSSHRLDAQMDLVGELVIALASLKLRAQDQEDPVLKRISEDLDQLVTDIRDNVLGIRMLPIGGTFGKFRRLVRDLSNEQGKDIELLTEGASTELDKSVIDQLSEPLVHLIRNSLDHGIESPAERAANGKSEKGHITLSAKHAQGHVIIQIKDDGKGIDANVIWNKVVEKGLAAAEARPADKDILHYIFAPGFSTAESITNISGRGVGMDVVKQAIEALRGRIDIDSTVGQGTLITLRLPLTLAIIDGLLVTVGSESLVLPLSAVEECVETSRSALKYSRRGQVIPVRESLVPCLPLQNWVGPSSVVDDAIQVVIVSLEGQRYGLIVDDVVGQEQIVIKSLGSVYQSIEGVSGATILGNGAVALILDLPKIIQLFEA